MTKQHELAKKVFNSSLRNIFNQILTEDLAESFKKSNIIVSRDAETGEAQKVSLIGSRTLVIEKKSQTVFHVRFDTEDHSMFGIRSLSKDSTDMLMVFENKINQFHLVQGFFDSIVQEYLDFCEQELLSSAATDFLTSKTSPADLYIDTEEELLKKEIPDSFEYVTVDVDIIKEIRKIKGQKEVVIGSPTPDNNDSSQDIEHTKIGIPLDSLGSEFIKDLTATLTPDPVEENSGTEIDKEETETQTVKRGKKSKK